MWAVITHCVGSAVVAGSKVTAAGCWACGAETPVEQNLLVSPVALLYVPVSPLVQSILESSVVKLFAPVSQ